MGDADVDRRWCPLALVAHDGREWAVYLDENNIWTSVYDGAVRNVEACEGWPELTDARLNAAK
jgi:hypothetical protein